MTTVLSSEPSPQVQLAQRQRPPGRPAMYQSWRDLLFLHWRFDADVLQSRLPGELRLDTFDGDAWVGIVPFFMRNIRPWWSPVVPGVSHFQELNLRTYVTDHRGVPGVWFLSLDANTRFGCWWGKTFYRLPYAFAHMTAKRDPQSGRVDFQSHRPGTSGAHRSEFTYQPRGAARRVDPGSLEFFLVERYALFSEIGQNRIATGRVHHPPYEVSEADAQMNDPLFALNGLPRPDRPADHVLVSHGVDVEVFPLETSACQRGAD